MGHLVTDVPEVVVKPGKMFTYSSSKMKLVGVVLVLIIYVYFLLFIKTIYMKNKRLDRIATMVQETKQQMIKLHQMDRNLASQLERLNQAYEGY